MQQWYSAPANNWWSTKHSLRICHHSFQSQSLFFLWSLFMVYHIDIGLLYFSVSRHLINPITKREDPLDDMLWVAQGASWQGIEYLVSLHNVHSNQLVVTILYFSASLFDAVALSNSSEVRYSNFPQRGVNELVPSQIQYAYKYSLLLSVYLFFQTKIHLWFSKFIETFPMVSKV